MTTRTTAQIAGVALLLYIAVGVQDASDAGLEALMTLACSACALVLGVTLFVLTRVVDETLAMLGLAFRVAEGIVGAGLISTRLAVQALGTLDPVATEAGRWNVTVTSVLFAIGSLMFAWLLVRGRLVPLALGWLGVAASAVLLVGLPFELLGIIARPETIWMWVPMAAFEVPLALWLLAKGARPSASQSPANVGR